jgi:DNA-binding winged helix-turn-helix (wHTH) protein
MMSFANEIAATGSGEHGYSFGPFRLFPGRLQLLEADNRIQLGTRALDVLAALVESAGHLVLKDELIARVWPNLFVVEANLKVQVSSVRRALRDGQAGNRYIATVTGRGYQFVAPVSVIEELRSSATRSAAKAGMHNHRVAFVVRPRPAAPPNGFGGTREALGLAALARAQDSRAAPSRAFASTPRCWVPFPIKAHAISQKEESDARAGGRSE